MLARLMTLPMPVGQHGEQHANQSGHDQTSLPMQNPGSSDNYGPPKDEYRVFQVFATHK
jgi:hypothetical protein